MSKRCLMITYDPVRWEAKAVYLTLSGVDEIVMVELISSAIKYLQTEKFDFGIISNTLYLYDSIPGVDENEKINLHTIGSVYIAPYFEERKIPYIILNSVYGIPEEIQKTLKYCIWGSTTTDDLTCEETVKILKKHQLI